MLSATTEVSEGAHLMMAHPSEHWMTEPAARALLRSSLRNIGSTLKATYLRRPLFSFTTMRPHGPRCLNRFSGDSHELLVFGTAFRTCGHGHMHRCAADALEGPVLKRVNGPANAYV